MNDYKLYIKDLSGVWKLADLGENKPYMNYQSNNINELNSRKANYSQELQLSFTPANCAIFDYVNDEGIISGIPYLKLECRLFCGNVLISGKGSYVILRGVTDKFSIQILSGVADFFKTISELDLSELDLGVIQLGLDAMHPQEFTDYYLYAFLSPYQGGQDSVYLKADDAIPMVRLRKIVEKICLNQGYTLETNLSEAIFNKYAVAITDRKALPNELFNAESSGTYNLAYENQLNFNVVDSGNGNLTKFFGSIGSDVGNLIYKSTQAAKIKLEITVNSSSAPVRLAVVSPDYNYITQSSYHSINQEINLNAGNTIIITIGNEQPIPASTMVTYNITFEYESVSDIIQYPGLLDIARNIRFNSQLEIFKAFVNLFGMIVDVDNNVKKVYAYTTQKLYDNKVSAIDWSDKLDVRDNNKSFHLTGYAQNNIIQFETNQIENITKSGSFQVNDLILEKNKTISTIGFESGRDIVAYELYGNPTLCATVPAFQLNDNSVFEFKGCKPHIIEILGDFVDVPIYQGSGASPVVTYQYNQTKHVDIQNQIDTFYGALINGMLTNTFTIERLFNLSADDVEGFSQFVPVYISRYRKYFYVNKIKNFVKGKLTKCELVKL
ncbi:MAG: hypothetical protein BGO29_14820 [Bacteroidales bacterium 36-12]|nr:MAG: hypothetical protein BGO29_14820 [Bacteroidales bacterium 36-12]